MEIGRKIRMIRDFYGLTQTDIAKIAGVSVASVSSWELGDKKPKSQSSLKICSRFGLNLADFLDETKDLTIESLTWTVDPDHLGTVQNHLKLSRDEYELVDAYRHLTDEGKDYIKRTIAMVSRTEGTT